jgi:hypothetical protein
MYTDNEDFYLETSADSCAFDHLCFDVYSDDELEDEEPHPLREHKGFRKWAGFADTGLPKMTRVTTATVIKSEEHVLPMLKKAGFKLVAEQTSKHGRYPVWFLIYDPKKNKKKAKGPNGAKST